MANAQASATLPVSAQRFFTSDFAPHERVNAWREAYGSIAKLEFEPVSEAPLTIEGSIRLLPDVGIATMATQGLRFSKPRNLIDSDDLILVMMESGSYCGTQLGREVRLGAGDAVIRWNAEVTTGEIVGRPSIIRVPTKAISAMVGDVSAGVQRRIPADTDALRLLLPYVRTMQHCGATPEVQRIIASHVHDLIALLLGAAGETAQMARDRGGRAARLRAIKTSIRANLAADLSVAAVAARQRLPVRYLQRLFEAAGTTFTDFVLSERLSLAHRMLTEARCADRAVSTIAFDSGFNHLSYFNRAFRARFGAAPSDIRAQARRVN